jgi:hypothetical protein
MDFIILAFLKRKDEPFQKSLAGNVVGGEEGQVGNIERIR